MPLYSKPIRQTSKKLLAKLKPVWLGKGIRCIGRGVSHIPLGSVITAVQTTGDVGSALPYLQGMSSLVALILQRADAVKRNHEECKDLAHLAERVMSAMVEVIGDVPEDELDGKTTKHIAELGKDMNEIVAIMERLKGKSVLRRFLRKDKHSDALAKHKQGLTYALVVFQTKELVAIRHAQHKDHLQTAVILQEFQTAGHIYTSTALTFHRLFF